MSNSGQGLKDVMRPVLGIETSCDETATAVVDGEGRVLADTVLSQLSEHSPFGGVVPEIAARSHLRYLPEQARLTMAKAGVACSDLGGIAATSGPGLIGGLIVGCQFSKGIAIANGLPFVAVNHLEAHALTARLPGLVEGGAPFPGTCCSCCPGDTRNASPWAALGTISGWAGQWTMRPGRHSIRLRSS